MNMKSKFYIWLTSESGDDCVTNLDNGEKSYDGSSKVVTVL